MDKVISFPDTVALWRSANPESGSLYALIDAAQNKSLWQHLADAFDSVPLLSASAENLSPHLIALPAIDHIDNVIERGIGRAKSADLTLIYSRRTLPELAKHFSSFLEVQLSGGIKMLLAFWDPAILGTLVGQMDDDTLHVPGPVFTPDQRDAFLAPMTAWWYRDREDAIHRIDGLMTGIANTAPLKLDQTQEDALVEASVPDQILYHLQSNRPTLFDEALPHHRRYRFVRAVLPSARQLGLNGMRDLTNFVAICLIYRQRIQTDPEILQVLDRVQRKEISFDEALTKMPE